MIDLHVHTTASDGSFSPKEIVEYALKNKLKAIAICDHNNFDSVEQCIYYAQNTGLEVIPGVEISTESHPQIHILAYFFDNRYLKMQPWLSKCNRYKNISTPLKIIKKLNQLGYNKINKKYVLAVSENGIINSKSILTALVKKRYFKTKKDAFYKLLDYGKPAYVPGRPSFEEVLKVIAEHGGISVLAHPYKYDYCENELIEFANHLKSLGLMGIEVYQSDMPESLIFEYKSIAERLGLLITGGSDFHGKYRRGTTLGVGRGNLNIDYSILKQLKTAANK